MLRSPTILLLLSLMAGCTLYAPDGGTPENVIALSLQTNSFNQLYLIQPNGRILRQLTANKNQNHGQPDWSPDGREIVYTVVGHPTAGDDPILFTMNADGSHKQSLADRLALDKPIVGYSPHWSPEGGHIAFRRYNDLTRNVNVFVINLETGSLSQVTPDEDVYFMGAWHPSGDFLLYGLFHFVDTPYRFEQEIYRYDVTTGQATSFVLPKAPVTSSPKWSPDGTAVAYLLGDRELGRTEIVRYTPATGAYRVLPLAQAGMNAGGVSWSPDGKRLAYDEENTGQYYIADAEDGRVLAHLNLPDALGFETEGVTYWGGMTWSPHLHQVLISVSAQKDQSAYVPQHLVVWEWESGSTKVIWATDQLSSFSWSPR